MERIAGKCLAVACAVLLLELNVMVSAACILVPIWLLKFAFSLLEICILALTLCYFAVIIPDLWRGYIKDEK